MFGQMPWHAHAWYKELFMTNGNAGSFDPGDSMVPYIIETLASDSKYPDSAPLK